MKNELTINGLNENIAYCEAIGLSKCFEAYAECGGDEIIEIGFRPHSGYTYIALENGITIASMLGQNVEYLVSIIESGEEAFFDTYEEAKSGALKLNESFYYGCETTHSYLNP